MLKAFSRASAPFVFATAALSIFAVHCGGDDGTPTGTAGTASGGTGGSAVGGSATGGGGSGTAGSGTSGSATGGGGSGTSGSASGGGGAGGAAGGSGGAGGATGGSGGAGGATGGSGGAGGSGGGTTVTFAQVKEVLASSCSTNNCHNGNPHIDWKTDTQDKPLYTRMTSAIGANGAHCKDKTPVVAGMPDQSLLVQIIKGKVTCGNEMIPRMPDDCPDERPCLTDDKIKLISDWIAGGAPK